jgi:hypothetical protein
VRRAGIGQPLTSADNYERPLAGQRTRLPRAAGDAGQAGLAGQPVTENFSGYKGCFELGVTEVGCMAHARRKFHELWANHQSQVAEQALKFFG